MRKNTLLAGTIFFLTRVFILYAIIVAGFFLWTDHKTVIRSAQLQTLSRLTPAFNYYEEFFKDPGNLRAKSLGECVHYHRAVADLVPAAASEAWGVAGFCAWGSGRSRQAVDFLGKAMEKNPTFFWNYYNLGVIAFNEKDDERAVDLFSRALGLDPKYTVLALARSKVYADILRSFGFGFDPQRSLAEGRERAMGLLRVSAACRGKPQSAMCQDRPRVHLQIF